MQDNSPNPVQSPSCDEALHAESVPRKIFCFWTGRNPMSQTRAECLRSMRENLGVPIELVTWRDLNRYILPEAPLHPGFKYLSCIHKSDYLRCYFMHFYGGGYADIKPYTTANNWILCFDIIHRFGHIEIIGQPEIIDGTPIKEYNNPFDVVKLLSVCYFICRPRSEVTTAWYNAMMRRMDDFLPALMEHPAADPFGRESGYPVPWSALLAPILHSGLMEARQNRPNAVCSALCSGIDRAKGWR